MVELAHQHLLQTAYTDGLVGQVIDKLKAEGIWDKSLVVMGADHGELGPGREAAQPGQDQRPRPDVGADVRQGPGPGQRPVDDRNWEQVDLLPTVADLAGVTVPWKMDGASQTGEPARTRTEKWWFDIPGHREVRDGPANWKVVLAGETDTLVRASEGVRGLYRYGPAGDLIYQPTTSVGPVTADLEATATLDDFEQYTQIKPGSGRIPALVSGNITSPCPGQQHGAGGRDAPHRRRVQAVPRRPGEQAAKFAVITPDTLWKAGDGRRQLQVFVVDRSGGARACSRADGRGVAALAGAAGAPRPPRRPGR